jgi:hypothetical protein
MAQFLAALLRGPSSGLLSLLPHSLYDLDLARDHLIASHRKRRAHFDFLIISDYCVLLDLLDSCDWKHQRALL